MEEIAASLRRNYTMTVKQLDRKASRIKKAIKLARANLLEQHALTVK